MGFRKCFYISVTYPGEDLENPFEDLDDDEKGEIFRSMMTEMFEKGWVRFKYTTNELNVDLLDTNNIPKNVDNFIVQHPAKEIYVSNISDDNNVRVDYDTAINLGLQKAVNKALSHKRLQHASLKESAYDFRSVAMWIDPNGQIYPVRTTGDKKNTHVEWIYQNQQLLKDKYNFSLPSGLIDDMRRGIYNYNTTNKELVRKGWIRVDGANIEVPDIHNVPNFVFDLKFMPEEYVWIEDLNHDYAQEQWKTFQAAGQKAINQALQQKRLQPVSSLKQAFLKEAFEEDKLVLDVDFDQTIAVENSDHTIGEPINGVKEVLTKLHNDGYEINIYSHRVSSDGPDEVREWLDKNEIPYDNILEVNKPLATYYIDDRNIEFHGDWNEVLKKVEKSDKTASLSITAYDRAQAAYWVDPSGKVYPVKTTHEDWFFENEELLRNQYHYDKDEIGQDWWDIKTGNLLNQLLEDGWLRVGDLFAAGRKYIGTGIEIANLNSIPSTLIDFVSNWGKDKYFQIEDLQRRFVELSVEELMADGQEAINRALQQEKMLSRRGSLSQKYWLDPSGKEYISSGMGHNEWAARNVLKMTTEDLKKNPNSESIAFEAANEMISKGWTRITTETDRGADFGIEVANLKRLPSYLDDFISRHYTGSGLELDDLNGEYAVVADPFPEIQRAVNRAMMMAKRMEENKVSVAKQASFEGYWLSPKGKAYEVPSTMEHDEWFAETLGFEKSPDMMTIAFERGWVRIRMLGSMYIQLNDIHSIPSFVDDFIVGHKAVGIVVDDKYGTENATISYDDAIKYGINKAVQRALRQPVNAKVFSKKEIKSAFTSEYWISPDGELNEVSGSHKDWIAYNPDLIENSGVDTESLEQKLEEKDPDVDYLINKIYKKMLKAGWVRVGQSMLASDPTFYIEVADLHNIPSFIDNLLVKWYKPGKSILNVGDMGGHLIEITEPFPSLQRAVNKTFRKAYGKVFSKKEIKAQVGSQYEMSSTQLDLPHDIAEKIIEWGVKEIPNEELFEDPKEPKGRQLEIHVTLKYGLLTDDVKEIEQALKGEKAPKIKFGKTSFFEPEGKDYDVVIIEVESEDLQKLNKKLCDSVKHEDTTGSEYHPHVTIAYVKRGFGAKYKGKDILDGEEIVLNQVIFSPVKGDKTTLELGNKKEAAYRGNISLWLAPDGKEYDVSGNIHQFWANENAKLLRQNYKYDLESLNNLFYENPVQWLIRNGWIRIDGNLPNELDLEIADIKSIPQAAEQFVWKYKPEMVIVEDLQGNDTSFDREEYSKGMMKKASGNNFFPSLFQAPNNEQQFQNGGPDQEIALNPDSVSDDETLYGEWWQDKPRSKDAWRAFISMFKQPLSKKENMTIKADEELVNIGAITLDGKKFSMNVPGDLLQKYFNSVTQYSHDIYAPDIKALDRERAKLHNQLTEYIFNTIAPNKNWKDFPMVSGTIRDKIAKFIDEMVPQDKEGSLKQAGESEEWDSHYGDIWKINDKVKLKNSDQLGIIKEINGNEIVTDSFKTTTDNIVSVDQSTFDYPHNTQWFQDYQGVQEPDKVTPVTYSPEMNPEFDKQNSPGGYPNRFCRKPESEWFSDEGAIVPALKNMWKNREAAINSLTRDVTSSIELTEHGYWVDPQGKFYDVRAEGSWNTHGAWTYTHREELTKQYPDFNAEQGLYFLLEHGWIRIGDSYGADYGIEAVDPSHLPSSVIDWVNGNLKNVKIENYATRKNVVINLPVDDLQETINNEFRLQKLAPVTASVHGYGGWINPSGEVLLAEDHGDVILENPDFFGITNPIDKKIIIWSKLYIALYNEGFVRFRVWSDDLWFETNTLDSLKVAENTIFKLLPDIKKITVNANDGAYKATVEEFKEKGFDAFSKQVPVMAKKAELIDFQAPNGLTFPVLLNPSKQEFLGFVQRYGIVRLLKGESGIYVWDANEMTHLDMVKALRALGYEDAENYFPKKGYTSKSVGDKVTVEDMNGHWVDVSIDELLSSQLVMAKQATVDIEHTKDWLLRHKTPMDTEDRAILYHGTPKSNSEVVRTNGLRQWSLLATTPEEAIHYAGRDRDLKPKDISLFEVHVPIDKLNGGVFASVAEALGPEYLREIKISKQAGSYSSTYSDAQGAELFNEQHYNDDSEEPYVDHQNRDYPMGMRDMNDSSSDYPKPADISPYVVRLDILYPGPDRPYPPGLMDYEVLPLFESLPASDGIEQGNPD